MSKNLLVALAIVPLMVLIVYGVRIGGFSMGKKNSALNSQGVIARLTGHGSVGGAINSDITIAAILKRDKVADGTGDVRGVSVAPRSEIKGHVVELIPPSAEMNFWCVNLVVNSVPELEGFNWLWFVKDKQEGDELSLTSGFGLTCEAAGVPVQPFEPVTKGAGFVGSY